MNMDEKHFLTMQEHNLYSPTQYDRGRIDNLYFEISRLRQNQDMPLFTRTFSVT